MRKSLLIIWALLLVFLNNISAQNFEWAKNITGDGNAYSADISGDKLGNVYVAGRFDGTINIGNTITLTSKGNNDIFLIKYSPAGEVIWARSAGGPNSDKPNALAVDDYGNAYLTGDFDGNMAIGSYNMVSQGQGDIFLIKYTPDGDLDWVQQGGGIEWDEGKNIALDKYSNVYITGYFRQTAQFGKAPQIQSLTSSGNADAFVAKYDPFGILQWVKKEGDASNDDYGASIAITADDNLFLARNSNSSNPFSNIYKYACIDGSSLWPTSYTINSGAEKTQSYFIAKDLAVDKDNNIYIIGDAKTNALTNYYYNYGYYSGTYYKVIGAIYKINNNEQLIYKNNIGYPAILGYVNDNSSYPYYFHDRNNIRDNSTSRIFVDKDNNLYISGRYNDKFTYLNWFNIQTNNSNYDGYLLKLKGNGDFSWLQRIYNDNTQAVNSVWLDPNNKIYIAGDFQKDAQMSRGIVSGINNKSLVAKLNQTNPFSIIYPNGNEKFQVNGNAVNIKFNNFDAFNVNLYWTTDNGLNWTQVNNRVSVTEGENTVSWSGPTSPSTNCKIKVENSDNISLNDASDNFFTSATLALSSPQIQNYWPVETNQQIKWSSVNIEKIKIEFSTDSGINWKLITDTVTASLGVYQWKVPNNLTMQAKIRLSDASSSTISSISPVFGIIPNLKVLSPNGGEVWQIGTNQEIKWTSISSQNLRLEYSNDGGSNWVLIDSNVVSSQGKYIWKVPKTPGENCKIRISDNAIPQGSDMSDAIFRIPIQNITVLSPSEGDSWLIGSKQQIKWISYGIDNVKIQYSLNNGIVNTTIVASYPADSNSYTWTVPNSATKEFRIKVLDASNNTLFGWSLANNISPIVLKNLRGGEYINAGEKIAINWEKININNIRIEYTTNNGINWTTIADNVNAANGTYDWVVPNTVSTNCKIRLTDVADVNSYDMSKAPFTIVSRASQTIQLKQGWNLISSYIRTIYPNVDSVLASRKSNVILMKNGRGNIYYPSFKINNIGDWAVEDGYQIKVTNADSLTLVGSAVQPETYPINIPSGWSIISYLRKAQTSINTALSGIASNLVIVKDGDGKTYFPSYGINDIGNMLPGRGYQIKVTNSVVLTYQTNPAGTSIAGGLAKEKNSSELEHFLNINQTDRNATLIFTKEVLSKILSENDEIGVFNQNGILSGAGKFNGSNLAVTVWGDDPSTEKNEGMKEGETFNVIVWNKQKNAEISISQVTWNQKEGNYATNSILIAETLTKVEEKAAAVTSYNLYQNYPNPFNPSTKIKFDVPNNEKVYLAVYNVLGKKVCELVNKELPAGSFEVEFNAQDLPSGMYFYRLDAGTTSIIKKMMLIK